MSQSSKWIIASAKPPVAADDAKVMQLLGSLNPLRADRYLEPARHPATPSTAPDAAEYVLSVSLKMAPLVVARPSSQPVELHVSDPGVSQPISARYNGLQFELPRPIVEQLKMDYTAGATPPPPTGADASDVTPAPSPISPPDSPPN
jgi:hypothetical protein